MILMLVFENRMHLVQHKVLSVLFANALLIFTSVQSNPFTTFVLLWIVFQPMFRRIEKNHAKSIDKAFKTDPNLDYYVHKSETESSKEQNAAPLPGMKTEKEKGLDGFVANFFENPFVTFIQSILLLMLLIHKREELTPDIFHFLMSV